MLVNMVDRFNISPTALMAFNITSAEGFQTLLAFAEEFNVSFIMQISERYLKDLTPRYLSGVVLPELVHSPLPFVLHLDHANRVEIIEQAIRWGFTSVMYDGSTTPIDENIRTTRSVLELARAADVSVEAEIGHVGGVEDGDGQNDNLLTTVDEAVYFIRHAPVDALAVAVGNAHGSYTKPPKLDIGRIQAISDAVKVPLVLHGGTGIPLEDLTLAIQAGVRKINIGTELKQAWLSGAREGAEIYREPDQVRALMKQRIHSALLQFHDIMNI